MIPPLPPRSPGGKIQSGFKARVLALKDVDYLEFDTYVQARSFVNCIFHYRGGSGKSALRKLEDGRYGVWFNANGIESKYRKVGRYG